MPRLVQNEVIFHHTDLAKIAALVDVFDNDGKIFKHLRPVPENEQKNSHNWCETNWGTICDVGEAICCDVSDNWLKCEFETAWTPPLALFDYLCAQGWRIECDYIDDVGGYVGRYYNGVNECFDVRDVGKMPDNLKQLVIEYCGFNGIVEFWGATA
jgi:hypothetical protein